MPIISISDQASPGQVACLAEMLMACVEGGAAVGYMADLSRETALAYWWAMVDATRRREMVLLALEHPGGDLLGTVQVSIHFPPSQAQVAGVQMLLVHPGARRQGIARSLMEAAEATAQLLGRRTIVLQTAGGAAGHLYAAMDYRYAGTIPDLHRHPDGQSADMHTFWKTLA